MILLFLLSESPGLPGLTGLLSSLADLVSRVRSCASLAELVPLVPVVPPRRKLLHKPNCDVVAFLVESFSVDYPFAGVMELHPDGSRIRLVAADFGHGSSELGKPAVVAGVVEPLK